MTRGTPGSPGPPLFTVRTAVLRAAVRRPGPRRVHDEGTSHLSGGRHARSAHPPLPAQGRRSRRHRPGPRQRLCRPPRPGLRGPARPLHARGGLRRPHSRRGPALDPAGPGPADSRRRDAGTRRPGAVAGGHGRAVHRRGARRLRRGHGAVGALGARRGDRPAPRPRLLLPLPGRHPAEPGRPDPHLPGGGDRDAVAVVRGGVLPVLPERPLRGLPPSRRGELDLVVHLGDYIYEDAGSANPAAGKDRAHLPFKVVTTLEDYRIRHAQYHLDPDLQAAHAAAPFLCVPDDHEVVNNMAGDYGANGNSTPEVFLPRRAAAYQAYYEHLPLRRSSMPSGPSMQLYRRLEYGDLASLHPARHPAVPHSAGRRPGVPAQRPRGVRPLPHPDRPGAGALAARRTGLLVVAVERGRPAGLHGGHRPRAGTGTGVQHGQVGRLPGGARPDHPLPAGRQAPQPGRAQRRRARGHGERRHRRQRAGRRGGGHRAARQLGDQREGQQRPVRGGTAGEPTGALLQRSTARLPLVHGHVGHLDGRPLVRRRRPSGRLAGAPRRVVRRPGRRCSGPCRPEPARPGHGGLLNAAATIDAVGVPPPWDPPVRSCAARRIG